MQDAKHRHFGTVAQLCVGLYLRNVSTIRKTVKQQYLLHVSSWYRELWPTNDWDMLASLGYPANFNGFGVLPALLHGTVVVGVSQTLRRWTEGATYIWQGGHHVGHSPTFLVIYVLFMPCFWLSILCFYEQSTLLCKSCSAEFELIFKTV